LDNVRVFDPQANRIILSGRQMSQEHMVEMRKNEVHDGWGLLHLAQYGAAYCNLNPQGLWIGVKVTPGDSDTRELHCRLTPNNVGCLQGLKRVKNYLPLTNWRGGSFETPDLEEISLLSKRRNDRTS
jgi:hypothetical protein